ncbi:Ca2+-binding EF-hand superfamily protein [Sphingomonas sp. F9_3S_D5_B_2]
MINSTLRLAAFGSVLALTASGPAFAQAAKPATAPSQITRTQLGQQLDAEYKELDANADGKLTKAEIETAMSRRASQAQTQLRQEQKSDFDKLDADHNGQLSLAEFQAQATITPRAGLADARVQLLDTNKDGSISATEYRNGTLTQFDRVDKNKDGVVSAAEASAARQ